MSEFIFKQECHKIIGCAMEVLNAIGRGTHDATRLRAVDRGGEILNRKWTQINANANSVFSQLPFTVKKQSHTRRGTSQNLAAESKTSYKLDPRTYSSA